MRIGVIGGGVAVGLARMSLDRFGSGLISYPQKLFEGELPHLKHVDTGMDVLNPHLIDAVYIATPVNTHKDFVIEATKRGIPVLVEKPLCLTIAESKEIDQYDTSKVAIAFKRRFSPMAKSMLSSRHLYPDKKCKVSYTWLAPHPGADHWKVNRDIAGGGVIFDIGCHVIDLFEFVVGSISQMSIQQLEIDPSTGTESFVRFRLDFEDGSEGSVTLGWASEKSFQKLDFSIQDEQVSWNKSAGLGVSALTEIRGRYHHERTCTREDEYRPMFEAFERFVMGYSSEIPKFIDGQNNLAQLELLAELADNFPYPGV